MQEIWIISYLVPNRFESFRRALRSFANQSQYAHVVISVCGPHIKLAEKWAAEILKSYDIYSRENRYSQFDQVFLLTNERRGRDVYVSLCDDDDYYTELRIEIQEKYINLHKQESKVFSFRCDAFGYNDFGCFCVHQKFFELFFDEYKILLKSVGNGVPPDLIFMAWIRGQYDEIAREFSDLPIEIPDKLYVKTNSSFQREWTQSRDNGDKWYSMILI